MVVEHRPEVRPRYVEQAAVLLVHVVERQPDGEDVVVRVGMEREVLVPLDRAPRPGGLRVELRAQEPDANRDQRLQSIEDRSRADDVGEDRPVAIGVLEASHQRPVEGMGRLEVIPIVVGRQGPGSIDRLVDHRPGGLDHRRRQDVLEDEVPLLPIERDLPIGEHVASVQV